MPSLNVALIVAKTETFVAPLTMEVVATVGVPVSGDVPVVQDQT